MHFKAQFPPNVRPKSLCLSSFYREEEEEKKTFDKNFSSDKTFVLPQLPSGFFKAKQHLAGQRLLKIYAQVENLKYSTTSDRLDCKFNVSNYSPRNYNHNFSNKQNKKNFTTKLGFFIVWPPSIFF